MRRAFVRNFAEQFVALTSSDQKKAEVSASLARKSLQSIADKYEKQVSDLWEAANKEALSLLLIVLQNNPKKSKDEIMKRPDVQTALRDPYETAAKKIEALFRDGWEKAETDAVQKVKSEFKLLGTDWEGYENDGALLDSLVADLRANAKAMRSRLADALTSDSPSEKVKGRAADGRRRATLGMHMAVWGSSSQARDSAFSKAGLNKIWLSRMDAATCHFCKDLHGMVVGPFDTFPVDKALKVYQSHLFGPPRHPLCRCVVAGTRLKKTQKNAA